MQQMIELAILSAMNAAIMALPPALVVRLIGIGSRRPFALAGMFYVLVYLTAVTLPYHFQGYSELTVAWPGEPLGWHAAAPIQVFAYLYTFKLSAFSWLAIAMCMIVYGEFVKRQGLDVLLKMVALAVAGWILTELDKYAATINMVLE